MKPETNKEITGNLSDQEYINQLQKCTKEGLICLDYHKRHKPQNHCQQHKKSQQEQLQEITKSYLESFNYFLLKTPDKCGEIAFSLTRDMYTALAKELLQG